MIRLINGYPFFDIRQPGLESSGTNNQYASFLVKKPKLIRDKHQFLNYLSKYTQKNAEEAYI